MNFKALSILSLLALSSLLSGCDGDSGSGASQSTTAAAPAPVNAAGTWRGIINSTVSGSNTATLRLDQYSSNLTALSGTFATSDGGSAPIGGTIHGDTASFTITLTGPGCSGSYQGTGVITIFGNGVKSMGYSSSVASNAACVGNEIVTGNLIFASMTTGK
ncbi:MAG: hypothetical protein ABSA86_06230 [Oryzomonas sp.]|jgi:hypothetical protein